MEKATAQRYNIGVNVRGPLTSTSASSLPLCVDLDGTLTPCDTTWEGVLCLLKKNPLYVFILPLWLLLGKSSLKDKIAARVELPAQLLPYHPELLSYLKRARKNGTRLLLVTGAPRRFAEAVAKHLELFDEVYASSPELNLVGSKKVALIQDVLGAATPFSYIGNSRADLHVWQAAHEGLVVTHSQGLLSAAQALTKVSVTFKAEPVSLQVWLKALRVYQWVKNLLVFLPVAVAQRFPSGLTWANLGPTLGLLANTFFAFCFCATSAYLFNDLWDLGRDRSHPTKKLRAFAAGQLPLVFGFCAVPVFLALGLMLAYKVSLAFAGMVAVYYFLTLAYSLKIREWLLVDVLTLSLLYQWRIFSGAVAMGILLSPWLIGFAAFFFYSLALLKRSIELRQMRLAHLLRAQGRNYELQDLQQLTSLGSGSGLVAVLILALYINSDRVQIFFERPNLLWPICFACLYWISRVWVLAGRGLLPHDPVSFTLRDPVSYLVGILVAVLYFSASLQF